MEVLTALGAAALGAAANATASALGAAANATAAAAAGGGGGAPVSRVLAAVAAAPRLLSSAGGKTVLDGVPFPTTFSLFLAQVAVILGLSKLISWMLRYIKQPAVVGEMLAGILLGPTALGRIPHFSDTLFPASSLGVIKTIADFALIFFMFIVGLELDPAKLRADAKISMWISIVGILVPCGASALLALIFSNEAYSSTSFANLVLFLTVTLGMSALPVLARILSERRMLATRLGGLAMTVAAVDDIMGWCLLAITIALIRSTTQLGALYVILLTIGELIFVIGIVGPLIRWLVRRSDTGSAHNVGADVFLLLCLILIVCSWLAEVIGLSSLIGAFQVGLLIPRTSTLSAALSEKIEYFTVVILMPLFFTSSGLRTQFGLINDGTTFGLALLVIVVATLSKIIGVALPCMAFKIPARMSVVIGVLMSCKGLVALIVVNLAYDSEIITARFFAILVLMVLITTVATVPLMQLVDPPSRAAQREAATRAFERAASGGGEEAGAAGGGTGDGSTRGGDDDSARHGLINKHHHGSGDDLAGIAGGNGGGMRPVAASTGDLAVLAAQLAAVGPDDTVGKTLSGPRRRVQRAGIASLAARIQRNGSLVGLEAYDEDDDGDGSSGEDDGDSELEYSGDDTALRSGSGGAAAGAGSGLVVDVTSGGGADAEATGGNAVASLVSSSTIGGGSGGAGASPGSRRTTRGESVATGAISRQTSAGRAGFALAGGSAAASAGGESGVELPSIGTARSPSLSASSAPSHGGFDGDVPATPASGSGGGGSSGGGVLEALRSLTRTMSYRLRSGTQSITSPSPSMAPALGAVGAVPTIGGASHEDGGAGGDGASSVTASIGAAGSGDIETGGATVAGHTRHSPSLGGAAPPGGSGAPTLALGAATQRRQRRRLRDAVAAAAARAHLGPVQVGVGVSDTSFAPSMVAVANLFSPSPDPLVPASLSARLTLVWLLEAMDMPSSYMNLATSVAEIRDPTLTAALARARLRDAPGGIRVHSYPSDRVLTAAYDTAAEKRLDVMLLPSGFLGTGKELHLLKSTTLPLHRQLLSAVSGGGGSAGDAGGSAGAGGIDDAASSEVDETMAIVRRALRSARPCLTAFLFDPHHLLYSAGRILVPVPHGSRMAEPALSFLKRIAPDADVTLLRVGASPPSSPAPERRDAAGGGRKKRRAASGGDGGDGAAAGGYSTTEEGAGGPPLRTVVRPSRPGKRTGSTGSGFGGAGGGSGDEEAVVPVSDDGVGLELDGAGSDGGASPPQPPLAVRGGSARRSLARATTVVVTNHPGGGTSISSRTSKQRAGSRADSISGGTAAGGATSGSDYDDVSDSGVDEDDDVAAGAVRRADGVDDVEESADEAVAAAATASTRGQLHRASSAPSAAAESGAAPSPAAAAPADAASSTAGARPFRPLLAPSSHGPGGVALLPSIVESQESLNSVTGPALRKQLLAAVGAGALAAPLAEEDAAAATAEGFGTGVSDGTDDTSAPIPPQTAPTPVAHGAASPDAVAVPIAPVPASAPAETHPHGPLHPAPPAHPHHPAVPAAGGSADGRDRADSAPAGHEGGVVAGGIAAQWHPHGGVAPAAATTAADGAAHGHHHPPLQHAATAAVGVIAYYTHQAAEGLAAAAHAITGSHEGDAVITVANPASAAALHTSAGKSGRYAPPRGAEASRGGPPPSVPAIPGYLRRRPNLREVFPSNPELLPALGRMLDGSPVGTYSLMLLGAQIDAPLSPDGLPDATAVGAAVDATARRVAECMALAAAQRMAVLLVLPRSARYPDGDA